MLFLFHVIGHYFYINHDKHLLLMQFKILVKMVK